MIDKAVERLTAYGYTVTDADKVILGMIEGSTTAHIKNATNLDEIPDGLTEQVIDAIVAHFLRAKKLTSPESLNFEKLIKSISEGDTSVTYDGEKSSEERLDEWIEYMLTRLDDDLFKYRVLSW